VELTIEPESSGAFDVCVRIPGWARGEPVPSDLYAYVGDEMKGPGFAIRCNGEPIDRPDVERGYVRIHRTWRSGDTITLDLDMPIRLVRAADRVEPDRDRLAIERGPVVYCLEGVDHGGRVHNLVLPDEPDLKIERRPDLLGGIVAITGTALAMRAGEEEGDVRADPVELTAIPYYAWQHRGPGEMAVWIPTNPALARIAPEPTVASMSRVTASYCYEADSPQAINDQLEPASSSDHSIPRLTWWDHRGTDEWVQMDFDQPREVSGAAVYWFDDTGAGECRVPAKARLLYREGGVWKPVQTGSVFPLMKDQYSEVTFDPLTTDGLRIEVMLRDGFSGGILEWRVH
jgi:hypothetical protein